VKIQKLKFSLKNRKSIGFIENRMIFLVYQMIFFQKLTVFHKVEWFFSLKMDSHDAINCYLLYVLNNKQ
jgi:hypothetical protein